MLLETLDASIFANMLTVKGVMRAEKGAVKVEI